MKIRRERAQRVARPSNDQEDRVTDIDATNSEPLLEPTDGREASLVHREAARLLRPDIRVSVQFVICRFSVE